MVQLQIHLHQCLLHVLLMRGSVPNQLVPLSNVGSEFGDYVIGPEAGSDQAVAVELLEPLGITDIRLPARDILGMPCIDENDLNSLLNKDFVQ
jgi:hypothetical protein